MWVKLYTCHYDVAQVIERNVTNYTIIIAMRIHCKHLVSWRWILRSYSTFWEVIQLMLSWHEMLLKLKRNQIWCSYRPDVKYWNWICMYLYFLFITISLGTSKNLNAAWSGDVWQPTQVSMEHTTTGNFPPHFHAYISAVDWSCKWFTFAMLIKPYVPSTVFAYVLWGH